jgi:cellulose synthase operon protein C
MPSAKFTLWYFTDSTPQGRGLMLPTINKRFLFKLVLALGLVAGSLAGAHALQARRIPDALKRQSARAADAGKKDAAISYLRQYLEFRPMDVDAQEELAELIKNRGSVSGYAFDLLLLYEKILRTDPNRQSIRREALKLSLNLGRNTDAETHAETLLKEFPDDAEIWVSLATAQTALQLPSETVEKSLNEAIRLDPNQTRAYQLLATYLLRNKQRPAEAKHVLDRLIEARPNDPQSYISRAVFETMREESQVLPSASAVVDLRKAMELAPELAPEHAEALLLLSEQLQRGRDIAGAGDLLANGLRLYPKDPRFVRNLAWLELNRGNIGSAVAVLEGALERVPVENSFELLVPLADLLVQLGETERSRGILVKLEARTTKEAQMQAKYIRGRLAMREDHWDEAIPILLALRSDTIGLTGLENQTNLLLSQCYRRQGNPAEELICLTLLTNSDPQHLAGLEALGRLHLNAGKFDDAIREYDRAAKSLYANTGTQTTLIKMRANHLRTQSPPATSAQWDALENEARIVSEKFGTSNSDGVLLRAEVATSRGHLDKAAALLRGEASRRPTDVKLWGTLATTLADLAGVPVGLAILDEAQAIAGDGPDLRLARATLYIKDPAKLRSIDRLAGQIDTWPDIDQQRLLDGLLNIYDRLGDDAGKLKTFRRLAGRRFTDASVWDSVYELAGKLNNMPMKAEAEAALNKLPQGVETESLRRAWDVLAKKDLSEAGAICDELVKRYGAKPDRTNVCVALGRLQLLQGNATAAGDYFDRAVLLEPTRFEPIQVRIAFHASQPGGPFEKTVEALAKDYRWSGEPFQRVIHHSFKSLDEGSAKKLLETAKKWNEGNVGEFAWLGESYEALNQMTEAGASYERAVQAPRATIDDWLRLARFQTGASSMTTVLERAKLKLPTLQYVVLLASIAESSATPKTWKPELKTEADQRQFTQASLAVKLSRYQRRESITLLETYLEGTNRAKGDLAWARRNLAMLYVSQGNPLDRKRAKEFLSTKDNSPGETTDEKRATAAVLAGLSRHLEIDDRKQVIAQAIAILRGVVVETKDPRDQFLLAQMCRTSGEREGRVQGRKLLLELLEKDKKNIEYLVAGLEEASEPEDREFADGCAKRLLEKFPTEFRAVAAVARYENRNGQPERSLALANAYARTANNTPGDLQLRYARAAELLDELARSPKVRRTELGRTMTNAAVDKYESVFANRPEAVVAAAGLLAADDRTTEAFAKIERHSKTLPMRVKVMAGLAVLRSGTTTPSQIATIQEWLTIAKNGEPGSIPVLLNEAEFYHLQGNSTLAEKAYEDVLVIEDRNVFALNNLAWLLAANPQKADRAGELLEKAVQEIGLTGELLDTRARIKIAARQYEAAERDLLQALSQEKTPLRMFHLALTMQGQTPPRRDEAAKTFQQAKEKGLKEQSVHPADIAMYRTLMKAGEK